MGVKPKHPLHHRDYIRRREAAYMFTAFPLPKASVAPSGESPLSLWFLQWEKRTEGGQPVPSSIVRAFARAPILILHHEIAGQSAGLNHWESDCEREGARTCNNQHTDLGRPSSHLQYPSSNPNQWLFSSAELN